MINLFFQAQSAGRFRAVLPMGRVGIFRPLRSLQLGNLFTPPSSFPFPHFTLSLPFSCVWWVTSPQEVEVPERQRWGAGELLSVRLVSERDRA